MTRSWDYPGRKHQVIKPVAANGQTAMGKMLKPMKSKTDEQVPTLSRPEKGRPEKPPVAYDVHTKGPLTYFQFYLDEVVQSADAAVPAKKQQSIPPTVLLGAGFVAITVVSGLLIGDALNKPTALPDTKIPPLKPKQRALLLVPRPVSAAPEKLVDRRFVPQSQRESQAMPPSVAVPSIAPRQNPVESTTPQSFAPIPSSVTLAAVPEPLTVSRSSSPKHSVTGAPAPAGMKPLVRPAYQELPDLKRPPQTPLTALNSPPPSAIAAPERINSGQSAATSPPVNPSQPSVTLTKPASLPPAQPSAASSPATPPQTEKELTAPNPSVPEPVTPATEPPPLSSPPNAIESKLPNSPVISNKSVKRARLTDDRSAIASLPAPSAQLASSPSRL